MCDPLVGIIITRSSIREQDQHAIVKVNDRSEESSIWQLNSVSYCQIFHSVIINIGSNKLSLGVHADKN